MVDEVHSLTQVLTKWHQALNYRWIAAYYLWLVSFTILAPPIIRMWLVTEIIRVKGKYSAKSINTDIAESNDIH